ncbi:MAG: diacylglycerol kinase family protein [Candidatus Nanopelagicales bacterium]
MTKVAIVVNPAKVDDVDGLREAVARRLSECGWPEPTVLTTSEDDPGSAVTRQAVRDGAGIVLAAGGDGTVAAVVSVLSGTGVALAVLPSGTGNLLARNLGLPTDLGEVVRTVVEGSTWQMDVGEVVAGPATGSSFAVMAGLGFDAAVVEDAPEQLKARLGWPAYLVSALSHVADEPFDCTIRLDGGQTLERTCRTVLVANAAGLQGGIDLSPDADVADGLLDVIVISPQGVVDWLRVGARLATGSEAQDQPLERFQARRIEITTATDQVCQLDGDPVGTTHRLTVEVRPGALTMQGPRPPDSGGTSAGPAQS